MNAYVNLENVRLETKRLILRAFQKNDVNDFYEYAKVEGGRSYRMESSSRC